MERGSNMQVNMLLDSLNKGNIGAPSNFNGCRNLPLTSQKSAAPIHITGNGL